MPIRRSFVLLVLLIAAGCSGAKPDLMPVDRQAPRFNVLVFSYTTGFRHASIPEGIEAVRGLARANHFNMTATEDPAFFTDDNLAGFDAVIFMNTNGALFDEAQKAAFERYIRAGGGYVGVHSAAATEYEWAWYGGLVGAWFDKHPTPQQATVQVIDRVHPSTKDLPATWSHFDEWYNYRINPRGNVHVLMTVDERSYEGGTMGFDHPIAWAQDYEGGRAWYTGLGHTKEVYADPLFLGHLLGGIEWAAGLAEGDARATLASNYEKVVLAENVAIPMELDIAEDGRVFFVERAGALMVWEPGAREARAAGWLPVHMVIEDGLLGLALDPGFSENHWLYLFYAPADAGPSRLSRFTFDGDWLDLSTEKILLTVPYQREWCCHHGGSVQFDGQGNLYLSTGENSNAYDPKGSPLNETPEGRLQDSQRSAGNTNDLRGKILRIHPEPDGTYTIPEGNLFPPGTPKTRPEIFTMGHRNPFRISIDEKTGYLYWGDVGNGSPPSERGPWGWDEFNQAKKAGFFGWPYFVGPNDAFNDYDYATGKVGPPFDPVHPINDSPNNTGLRELPPAQPAMIWYTYGASDAFPEMGSGGISPMAGPVFHRKPGQDPHALPAYFDGKLILYEWMRNWMMEVAFDDQGDLMKISPFLPGLEFVRPVDVEVGPDGRLYVLEWGDDFWGSNKNARLVRVDYLGAAPEAPAALAAQVSIPPVIAAPADGAVFDFDTPIPYDVRWEAQANRTRHLEVLIYDGFDTYMLPLDTLTAETGVFTIPESAYRHIPDLHFMDRFAEVEACVVGDAGSPWCSRVKLQPRRKQAEHATRNDGATRQVHGVHPADQHYPETALPVMMVRSGNALGYAPIDLTGIGSLKLRIRQQAAGVIEARLGGPEGRLIGRVDLDAANSVPVTEIEQAHNITEAQRHDQAIDLSEKELAAYTGWSETTLPIEPVDGQHELVLVFSGPAEGVMLQFDWMEFVSR
ncbi:MAG: ThuA domain-containing protein [Rhodothermales bacterium]